MSAFAAVDDFLTSRYRVGLADVLCAGCLQGPISPLLDGVAEIRARPVLSESTDDDGGHFAYAGALAVAGVSYRFRCRLFRDAAGRCFLGDVPLFEPVAWQTRMAMTG